MDRPALAAVALGVVAAAAAALTLVLDLPALALVAGAAGLGAAALAVVGGGRERALHDQRTADRHELEAQRRELRRVRTALEDAEARLEWRTTLTSTRAATEGDQLTDPETGLLAEGWFVVALDSRIAAARRHLRPVAVVVLDVVTGLDRGRPVAADPRRVATAIVETIREADDAFRLQDGTYALLLEDTTDSGATWTTERIRLSLQGLEPDAVLWAGVSCYPAHGLTTDEVLDRADQALDAAREWRQHRIEVASADG